MTRKLTIFVAALAIGATTASGASAESFHFEAVPAQVTGALTAPAGEVFGFNAGKVKCKKSEYLDIVEKKEVASLGLFPTYEKCELAGVFPTVVETNGCELRVFPEKEVGAIFEGSTDIACPVGKVIKMIASSSGLTKCTLEIPPQEVLKTNFFLNIGEKQFRGVTMAVELAGMKYSQKKGTGLGACPEQLNNNNGTYDTEIELIGENVGRIGFWIE